MSNKRGIAWLVPPAADTLSKKPKWSQEAVVQAQERLKTLKQLFKHLVAQKKNPKNTELYQKAQEMFTNFEEQVRAAEEAGWQDVKASYPENPQSKKSLLATVADELQKDARCSQRQ